MNMKLYGICFKMRGGPDLLDHIQSNTAVPVDVMEQVMTQMESVTEDELDFAHKLDKDWKKAFNERVPLLMGVAADGGYDITCTVPDELLNTVGVLTGLENEKIIEEYTADYLKNVCGVEANIISVDVENDGYTSVKEEVSDGFSLDDLSADPDGPKFDDISEFSDMDMSGPDMVSATDASITPVTSKITNSAQTPVTKSDTDAVDYEDLFSDDEDSVPIESDVSMETGTHEEVSTSVIDGIPVEEGFPADEAFLDPDDFPDDFSDVEDDIYGEDQSIAADESDTMVTDEQESGQEEDSEKTMQSAVAGIYKEMVTNIRDRKLDERLGLRIGQ